MEATRYLCCCGLAPSSRFALPCIFHHSKHHGPPRHTLHWWDEFRCPELRGIRAVVQFLRQSAEPCAAPPTSPFHGFDDGIPWPSRRKLVSRGPTDVSSRPPSLSIQFNREIIRHHAGSEVACAPSATRGVGTSYTPGFLEANILCS